MRSTSIIVAASALIVTVPGCGEGNGSMQPAPPSDQALTVCGPTSDELDPAVCDGFLQQISDAVTEDIPDSPAGTYDYAVAWCEDEATSPPVGYTPQQVEVIQQAARRTLCPT